MMPEAFTNFPDWQNENSKRKMIYVHNKARNVLLIYFHSSTSGGHIRQEKLKVLIKCKFFWPSWNQEISKYDKECNNCQLAKQPLNSKGSVPRSRKGNNCILILADDFRKFTILLPLCQTFIRHEIFGGPELLISDYASYFNSQIIKYMCFEWGVRHVNMIPYYPSPNLVECVNKNVMLALSIFHNSDQCGWDLNISQLSLAFNLVPHRTTGFSPIKVFLVGELPSHLLNIWSIPPESFDVSNKKVLENL
ncbi:hypothetical protein PR048_027953 [Dryococelus australis]|uniref:RNA-directed DNA polymerase n=1 Tax=Dryococelus australis TaxID=614101 RepID=A0ABQ9GHV9_9NEOP|nr:hypothetical protein PR048_027953 [Dryococelus australis]